MSEVGSLLVPYTEWEGYFNSDKKLDRGSIWRILPPKG